MASIEEWTKRCHELAREKGFWGDGRDNIWAKLLLITSEVAEATEELRNNRGATNIYYNAYTDAEGNNIPKPEGFGIELADAMIRIFDLAGRFGLDLELLMEEKMEFNEKRLGGGYGGKLV